MPLTDACAIRQLVPCLTLVNNDSMTNHDNGYRAALAAIWNRSGYDRGFISDPFAGDEAAKLGLKRTQAVLEILGNPHQRVPLIHVAGSKGKGSTTVLLDAILRAAGRRSGRFTSPHLHSYRERFVVDDELIPEDAFATLTDDVISAVQEMEAGNPALGRITAWELSTAMALLWFARSGCDVAIIEVGLGGTLDATNVIDPIVSAITRLDFEHTAILGDTLPEIASNKAGIIKPGRPSLTVDQPSEALAVIVERAREVGSDLLVQNRDWAIEGDEDEFAVTGPWGRMEQLRTSLIGQHQVENAALAVATIRTAFSGDAAIDDEAIREGLRGAKHPGRFEVIPGTPPIVIDGAHTPIAAESLAAALIRHIPAERVTFVVGMLSDKHPAAFLTPLQPRAGRWIVTEPATPRRMPASLLVEALTALGQRFEPAPSIASAIDRAREVDSEAIVVTGSLTTVAEARVHLGLATPDPPPNA
jgi:dihydrofolate synthase/folylpolyglutamate synthase